MKTHQKLSDGILLPNPLIQDNLSIFDFDGTLANTPEKPLPNKRGDWDGKNWWGSKHSLIPPLYNGELHKDVFEAFINSRNDKNTKTVLVTGRTGYISPYVRKILYSWGTPGKRIIPASAKEEQKKYKSLLEQGLEFDIENPLHDEYFKGDFFYEEDYPKNHKGKIDVDSIKHKIYIFNKLLHSNLKKLEIWDDRVEHYPYMAKFAKSLINNKNYNYLKDIKIYRVFNYPDGYSIQTVVVDENLNY